MKTATEQNAAPDVLKDPTDYRATVATDKVLRGHYQVSVKVDCAGKLNPDDPFRHIVLGDALVPMLGMRAAREWDKLRDRLLEQLSLSRSTAAIDWPDLSKRWSSAFHFALHENTKPNTKPESR